MTKFKRGDHFALRDDLVVEEIDDDVVVLDLDGNQYFGLNEVGWLIWRALDETDESFGDIADAIADEFDIEVERARRDAAAFIEQLLDAGLASRRTDE